MEEEKQEVNYIDIWEFREFGYLQEINRRLLHPLGLAMEWRNIPEEAWRKYLMEALTEWADSFDGRIPPLEVQGGDIRLAADRVIVLLQELRLVGAHLSGVWDERQDPEGINYAGEYLEDMPQKAANVSAMWRQRKRARVEALRYMVQPSGLDGLAEHGSTIVELLADALGEELHSAIGVKASSESWAKTAQGVLDKLSQKISEEDYAPDEVTAEEVHVIDLILMPENVGGVKTRLEAVNMLVDRARFYKELYEHALTAITNIANGDIPPGKDPQQVADETHLELGVMLRAVR